MSQNFKKLTIINRQLHTQVIDDSRCLLQVGPKEHISAVSETIITLSGSFRTN